MNLMTDYGILEKRVLAYVVCPLFKMLQQF